MTKPIYHFSCKIINRKKNKSIVAHAAYISGTKLYDKESKRNWNYTGKDEVKFSDVLLPANAPERLKDASTLWNEVDELESRADAQLARSFDVALPNQWSEDQCKRVMLDFVNENFVNEGMAVQVGLHMKEGNYHFHVLAPLRGFNDDGTWQNKGKSVFVLDQSGEKIPILNEDGTQKVRKNGRKVWLRKVVSTNNWGDKNTLKKWRENWAEEVNKYLPEQDWISEKTLIEQGITDRTPTVHEGAAGRTIAAKGQKSWKVERNQRIKRLNEMRQQMIQQSQLLQIREQEFERLKEEIEEEERKEKEEKKQQEQQKQEQKTESGTRDYSQIINQKPIVKDNDEEKKQTVVPFTPEQRERYDKYFIEMARQYVELESINQNGLGTPNLHGFVVTDKYLSYENLKRSAETMLERDFDYNQISDKGLIGIYQENKAQIDGYFSHLPVEKQSRSDAARAVTVLRKGLKMYTKQLDDNHEIVQDIGNRLYKKNRKSCLDKRNWEEELKRKEEYERRHQDYELAHATYEFKRALHQLNYNLSVHMSPEKRQALRDYQEAEWKAEQVRRRMQRGFDFD